MSPRRSGTRLYGLLALIALVAETGLASAAPPAEEAKAILRDVHGDPLPAGAIARLGTIRLRTGCAYFDFAFSPDGKVVVTAVEQIRVWDVGTGKEIRVIPFPDKIHGIETLTISPDGKLFATNGYNADGQEPRQTTIYVGEIGTGKIIHRWKEDHFEFSGIQFSPDGKLLAAGRHQLSRPSDVIVWEVGTGKTLRRFPNCSSFSFSPDGKTLAVGQKDGTISLHDPWKNREPRSFSGHRRPVTALAFSPDGKTLASGDGRVYNSKEDLEQDSAPTIRGWDVSSGKETWQFNELHGHYTRRLCFSPRGQCLLAENLGHDLLDSATGKLREHFGTFGSYVFSPDGKSLTFTTHEGFCEWDLATNKVVRRWGDPRPMYAHLAFSPDGKIMASDNQNLHLWDVRSGKELHVLPGHRTAIESFRFSPEGKRVASIDQDGGLYLWETSTGKPLASYPGNPLRDKVGAQDYSFTPNGQRLSAIAQDGRVRVWDSTTGELLRSFRIGETLPGGVAISPDGKTLAAAEADHELHLWDMATGKQTHRFKGCEELISFLRFSPDSKTLVAQLDRTTVCLWDVTTGRAVHRFEGWDLAFSPDSRRVSWEGEKGRVLWDLVERKELRFWPYAEEDASGVAFSGDGKTVAAGNDRVIRLWDSGTGREIRQIDGVGDNNFRFVELDTGPDGRILARYLMGRIRSRLEIMDVATGRRIGIFNRLTPDKYSFAPDGATWAIGTQTIRVRAVSTGKTLWESPEAHRARLTALAYSPDGKLLASASEDGTILIWDASSFTRERFPDAFTFSAKELDGLWSKLLPRGDDDDREAYHSLLGTPRQTPPFLRERLQRLTAPDTKQFASWIAELDNEDFDSRKKAQEELAKWGKLAAPALRKTLADKPSAELKSRAAELLDPNGSYGKLPPDWQRAEEALRLLEQMNTPESRKALEELARTLPGSWLAEEARAALNRPVKFRDLSQPVHHR